MGPIHINYIVLAIDPFLGPYYWSLLWLLTEAATEEKDSQADCETMMSDSASKRADDAKSLTDPRKIPKNTGVH